MRVLHINCNYTGTALHQLMIEKLSDLEIENQVFAATYDKNSVVIKPDENVCVCECFKKWDRFIFDYKQKKIMSALEKQYDVSSFDLIHAYTLFTDGNSARELSKKYGIPYVVAIRNTDVNVFFRLMPHLRSRGVQIMQDAAAIFFLSEPYRKQVFEKYVPEKCRLEIAQKTYIIPNGIDDFWLQNIPTVQKNIDKKAIKLVYAGRIDRNKNIPTTQKAMELLREQGIEATLTVVGKIQDNREFEKISKDKFTTYLPAMPKEKLIDIYRQSDIFVMPSHTETFGLVYAEAMSQGLPVIYTKGQGFDGQFEEGTVGYSVSDVNYSELANAIESCINNYSFLSAQCTKSITKFDWIVISSMYNEIYSSLLKNGRYNAKKQNRSL